MSSKEPIKTTVRKQHQLNRSPWQNPDGSYISDQASVMFPTPNKQKSSWNSTTKKFHNKLNQAVDVYSPGLTTLRGFTS